MEISMNKLILLTAIALLSLSACTQLGDEDRALISSAAQAAQEAKEQSILAAEEARAARADADKSAKAAQAASDKADRIFRQGQNK
jgi:hypothetical protein